MHTMVTTQRSLQIGKAFSGMQFTGTLNDLLSAVYYEVLVTSNRAYTVCANSLYGLNTALKLHVETTFTCMHTRTHIHS